MSDALPEMSIELRAEDLRIGMNFEFTDPTWEGSLYADLTVSLSLSSVDWRSETLMNLSNHFQATVLTRAASVDIRSLHDALRKVLESGHVDGFELPSFGDYGRLTWQLRPLRNNEWLLIANLTGLLTEGEFRPSLTLESRVSQSELERFRETVAAMARFIDAR